MTRKVMVFSVLLCFSVSMVIADQAEQFAGNNSMRWSSIASSADGTHLAATDGGYNGDGGYIWTSTDSGVTWTDQQAAGKRRWTAIASSADGAHLAAASESGNENGFGDIWTLTVNQ